MSGAIDMGWQVGAQALRFGWYFGLRQLLDRQSARLSKDPKPKPTRPVPSEREILADLGQLFLRDALAVREGIMPASSGADSALDQLRRAQDMFKDLPEAMERRQRGDATSVRQSAATSGLPDYFIQDFHFQTDGYLSERSAKLYDIQVETLFLGGAAPMRREALHPIADFVHGRDQRKLSLLDVACGTGRLLRDIRLTYPAMALTGLDLSTAYLDEARRHLAGLRPAQLMHGNAEHMPLADASQDIVTSSFLFHELPPEVRRRVAAEMARVLKPSGLLVFIDSLQMGDRPSWDGLLEAFPTRFHEPYYRHYAIDDLEALFAAVGLRRDSQRVSFFSKVMVRRKAG